MRLAQWFMKKPALTQGKSQQLASDTSLSTTAMTQEWQSKAGN
jgi:hypothetical protein